MLDVNKLIKSGQSQDFLFFWSHKDKVYGKVTKACLSQFYPAVFTEGSITYNCAEQYMMASKAKLMGDFAILQQIMVSEDPKIIKALGRKVKNFDSYLWNINKTDIVVRGNMLKFSQNPMLKAFLLSTGDKVLVEASPTDTIWGIGLPDTDPRVVNPREWRGANLLGFALMEVRTRLHDSDDSSNHSYKVSCGVTPEMIKSLNPNEVFVFGSNLMGAHAGGAARTALRCFGAKWGVGVGIQGQSYAIPTMHGGVDDIRPYVDQFIDYAKANPHRHFLVTKIGCGIAGFKEADIAPLFAQCLTMPNVSLPKEFIEILRG